MKVYGDMCVHEYTSRCLGRLLCEQHHDCVSRCVSRDMYTHVGIFVLLCLGLRKIKGHKRHILLKVKPHSLIPMTNVGWLFPRPLSNKIILIG